MEKVIRDGKVAVLISPGFGAGWSTWNRGHNDILLFHPKLVEMVEQGKQGQINDEWMKENFNLDDVYCGGAEDLEIVWLDEGSAFTVEEYDGSESIRTCTDLTFTA